MNSPELAIDRVAKRVASGGHNIPADIIRRRYQAGMDNLFRIYIPCVDYWMLADNTASPRIIVAEGAGTDTVEIYNQEIFNIIRSHAK